MPHLGGRSIAVFPFGHVLQFLFKLKQLFFKPLKAQFRPFDLLFVFLLLLLPGFFLTIELVFPFLFLALPSALVLLQPFFFLLPVFFGLPFVFAPIPERSSR